MDEFKKLFDRAVDRLWVNYKGSNKFPISHKGVTYSSVKEAAELSGDTLRHVQYCLWDTDVTYYRFFSPYDEYDRDYLIERTLPSLLIAIARGATVASSVVIPGKIIYKERSLEYDTRLGILGALYLDVLLEMKIVKLEMVRDQKKNITNYFYEVIDSERFLEILSIMKPDTSQELPLTRAPETWTSGIQGSRRLVKGMTKGQLKKLDSPMILRVANKIQSTPWVIDQWMLETYRSLLEADSPVFPHNRDDIDEDRRSSLELEAKVCLEMADKVAGTTHYHDIFMDYRGRLYCKTSYLSYQGSDRGKCLLQFRDGKPIGEDGIYFLAVHMANLFGHDKVPLDDRVQWVLDHELEIAMSATDPLNVSWWHQADKPLTFLAACREWFLMSSSDDPAEYVSRTPVAIDGSCSGLQHLSAMARDEEIGHLVNLTNDDQQDIYMYVAKHTWDSLDCVMTKDEIEEFLEKDQVVMDSYREDLSKAWKSLLERHPGYGLGKRRMAIHERYKRLRVLELRRQRDMMGYTWNQISDSFWGHVDNPKDQRSCVKRPSMTLSYSVSMWGMGEQVWEDTRHKDGWLSKQQRAWATRLGKQIYRTCLTHLSQPMGMMEIFKEVALRDAREGRQYSFLVPVTSFPFQQSYWKKKRIITHYKFHNGDGLNVGSHVDTDQVDIKKTASGSAPNSVHALDAAHMCMCIDAVDYPMVGVHDSFVSLASDMPHLFDLVREKFVELYEDNDPLTFILMQKNSMDLMPERGNLDLSQVTDSEFCFA